MNFLFGSVVLLLLVKSEMSALVFAYFNTEKLKMMMIGYADEHVFEPKCFVLDEERRFAFMDKWPELENEGPG
jgi:hypothetical protein